MGAVRLAAIAPFRLGAVEVRPATREIVADGARELLEPRVMEVLVVLAEAPGEVVAREALVERCWGGRAVSEDAINRTIARLRRLAEGIARDGFAVETVVKVGYRLVERGMAADASAPEQPPAVSSRRAWLTGAGAAAVGVAGASWWWLRAPDDPAATLRERAAAASRPGAADGTAETVGFLREATRLRPDDARNWGALALAYQNSLYYLGEPAHRVTAMRMREAATRALELDPREIGARTALAVSMPRFGAWARAEAALRAVLASQPEQLDAGLSLSHLLSSVGRNREALAALTPLTGQIGLMPSVQYWRARLLWITGRLEESDAVIERAFQLWPRDVQVWFTRFWLLSYTGRGDAARAMLAVRDDRPPGIPEWNFALVESSALALKRRDPASIATALALNDRAARQGRGFAENAVELAAALGRLDTAFGYLGAYFFGDGFTLASQRFSREQSTYTPPGQLQTKFLFSPPSRALRDDQRFAALTRRIGLDAYWRSTGTRPDR